jgi:asparagine synthase (glutamine-hydrolysing)
MAAIAGITKSGERKTVARMLDRMSYRGKSSREIFETEGMTLGIITSGRYLESNQDYEGQKRVADEAGSGHLAEARIEHGKLELVRDELGVAPLYYDLDAGDHVYFASEVKGLIAAGRNANELLAGYRLVDYRPEPYYDLVKKEPIPSRPETIAHELKNRLTVALRGRICSDHFGAWLSGGLDSSCISALARPLCRNFHTFVAGLKGARDVEYAREVAAFIGSRHHELLVTPDDLRKALPVVIYHLESFDALLVRSSIMNFLVAKMASDHVSDVFSGEGGDELFAGYHYLKSIPGDDLDEELVRITGSLHNTAFQRVDRCSAAHGLTAHVVFADPNVFEFAMRVPVKYKLFNGIEKWILRRSLDGLLPGHVLERPKVKFWEGAGVNDILAEFAEGAISDHDFKKERELPNGWTLNTKEELYYYRIFKEQLGEFKNLDWMGRTQGSPSVQ